MRSAGCIVNDILDKELDKKVFRTKNRPIASGKISIKLGLVYAVFLCFFSLLVLLNFNNFTIILALGSMPLAFSYPLMKRYTYWPQLFLGITFNYGLILGWTSIHSELTNIPIILYFGAIFWTLGYDTIYGFQDIKDDELIGVKSTSIKFKKNPKIFIMSCYLIFISTLITVGIFMNFKYLFFIFLLLPTLYIYFLQIKKFRIENPMNCLEIFKKNNFLGFLIFANILIGKIF
tara:strand:- start:226 stop:924 length:699 start_codon:yes stop_codon:yes gene_type:complete